MHCSACAAPLETPLACGACGALHDTGLSSPFELFGLEERFELDPSALRKRLIRFSRWMHPDYFATLGEEPRRRAERNTAALNRAHEILSDDFRRASWLLERWGGPSEGEERAMPQAFLMEVLDWNEALEAARAAGPGSSERIRLDELAATLIDQRRQAFERVGRLLSSSSPRERARLVEARRELNAVRYLERTLEQIEALRVEQASAPR